MSTQTKPRHPHRLNAPGDFYVEDGCCTACGVPQSVAGEFFGEEYKSDHSSYHCFILKQPSSTEEENKLIDAMECQEFDCIRYRGRDRRVLEKLTEKDQGQCCDIYCN